MERRGFDCHAHVYDQVETTLASNYRPSRPAPLATWQQHLDSCALRGGVLVQPSFLGHDNSQLLARLAELGAGYRGVAQLPASASLEEMQRLDAAGIVGVRWNLIEHRAELPDLSSAQWRGFLDRLATLDWHLEIHLESDRLPELGDTLFSHGVTLVFDHFGLPAQASPQADPGFRRILEAGRGGRVWTKLSAPYRSPVPDIQPHMNALLDHLSSERLVWGSDWPWTRHEGKHSYLDTFAWLQRWVSDPQDYLNILEAAPRQLFRLPAPA